MNRTRRIHTEEFKREAVSLIAEQGYSYAEAGRSLGVNAGLIAKWRQIFESALGFLGWFKRWNNSWSYESCQRIRTASFNRYKTH